MFERWCSSCEKPEKCTNYDGKLYCINCGNYLGLAK